jgi:hypothetical protein
MEWKRDRQLLVADDHEIGFGTETTNTYKREHFVFGIFQREIVVEYSVNVFHVFLLRISTNLVSICYNLQIVFLIESCIVIHIFAWNSVIMVTKMI